MSLKLTGWPVMGFMTPGFLIFQARAFSGAAMRMAACTLSSGVSLTLNALPAGRHSMAGRQHSKLPLHHQHSTLCHGSASASAQHAQHSFSKAKQSKAKQAGCPPPSHHVGCRAPKAVALRSRHTPFPHPQPPLALPPPLPPPLPHTHFNPQLSTHSPCGLSGPQGSGSALTSATTRLLPPSWSSTAGSRRTQNRCWWLEPSTPTHGGGAHEF
jgi:hypothetical protein